MLERLNDAMEHIEAHLGQWFPSNPCASRPGPEILRVRLTEDGKRAEAELWIPLERSAES
ncbi:hypothetical protein SAMN02745831_00211 [Streptomyces sp. PgraA7]|nr:hypothetical protein SAMN02745831_00211 [Streptomyces sp. PgraA7]